MQSDPTLIAKLALEREIRKPWLAACAAYLQSWAHQGGAMSTLEKVAHKDRFETLLARHYARVAMVMTGRRPPLNPSLGEAGVSMRHTEKMAARAHDQALRYIEIMDRELARAAREGKSIEIKDAAKPPGGAFSVRYVGQFFETVKNVYRKLTGKADAVANVETQEPAEQSRYEWVEQHKANSTIVKTWRTMLDERVRDWHRAAEGQERVVDQLFDVGGEHLMQPGDASHGASLRNLINCRCSATYSIIGPNGEREPMGLETVRIPARRTWHQGDKPGAPTPIRPTELVTLNGRTNAKIVLGDGKTLATLRQETPSTIVVKIGRRTIARAETHGEAVTSISVDPAFGRQGIEDLIRRSVSHSAKREWMTPR